MKIQKSATRFPKENFQAVGNYATAFDFLGDESQKVTLRFRGEDGKWTRIKMSVVEAATLSAMLANATKDRGEAK